MVRLNKELIKQYIDDMISMSSQLEGDYWKLNHYLLELNHKWELSYAIISQNVLLGFMVVSNKGEHHHLHRIVIAENHQARGLGSQLLEKLIFDARQSNKSGITLKVHPDNHRAIHIYEKIGFVLSAVEGENHVYFLKI